MRFFWAIIWPRQARGPLKISQGCCEISTVARLMSKKSRKLMGKQSSKEIVMIENFHFSIRKVRKEGEEDMMFLSLQRSSDRVFMLD